MLSQLINGPVAPGGAVTISAAAPAGVVLDVINVALIGSPRSGGVGLSMHFILGGVGAITEQNLVPFGAGSNAGPFITFASSTVNAVNQAVAIVFDDGLPAGMSAIVTYNSNTPVSGGSSIPNPLPVDITSPVPLPVSLIADPLPVSLVANPLPVAVASVSPNPLPVSLIANPLPVALVANPLPVSLIANPLPVAVVSGGGGGPTLTSFYQGPISVPLSASGSGFAGHTVLTFPAFPTRGWIKSVCMETNGGLTGKVYTYFTNVGGEAVGLALPFLCVTSLDTLLLVGELADYVVLSGAGLVPWNLQVAVDQGVNVTGGALNFWITYVGY